MPIARYTLNENKIKKIRQQQIDSKCKPINSSLKTVKCNICNYETDLEFLPVHAPHYLCPNCRSEPKVRLYWYYLQNYTNLLEKEDLKILHTAAESSTYHIFKKFYGENYIASDISDRPTADKKVDVRDIPYPDNTFDLIISSHVLEHVDDDEKAMREFYRVLKPKGTLVLLLPALDEIEETIEYDFIDTEELKKRYYKHNEHVRYYGRDVFDKLESAGFKMNRQMKYKILSHDYDVKKSVLPRDPLFIGVKDDD